MDSNTFGPFHSPDAHYSPQFLLGLLLAARANLHGRSRSPANTGYFERLSKYCKTAEALLRAADLKTLAPSVVCAVHALDDTSATYENLSREFAKTLSPEVSHLKQDSSLTLPLDSSPARVLFSIGPNIGIGDEMMYFATAKAIRSRWPKASIEVSSFNNTLWDLCPEIDRCNTCSEDPQAPFLQAAGHSHDERAVIIFADFNCATMYRMLETVSSIPRFLYLDAGAKVLRLVDQGRGAINEVYFKEHSHTYDVLESMNGYLGLESRASLACASGTRLPSRGTELPSIFLNAFSTKNYLTIAPEWWAAVLDAASNAASFTIDIFQGLNQDTEEYARRIDRAIMSRTIPARVILPTNGVSIRETLVRAAAASVILGVDTFTSHIGFIRPVPRLTVYLNLWDEAWTVPEAGAIAFPHNAQALEVGSLLAGLLHSSNEGIRSECLALVAATEKWSSAIEQGSSPSVLALCLDEIKKNCRRLCCSHIPAQILSRGNFGPDFASLPKRGSSATHLVSEDPIRTAHLQLFNVWRHNSLLLYAAHHAQVPVPKMIR